MFAAMAVGERFFGIVYQELALFPSRSWIDSRIHRRWHETLRDGHFASVNYYEVPPEVQGSGNKLKEWASAARERRYGRRRRNRSAKRKSG